MQIYIQLIQFHGESVASSSSSPDSHNIYWTKWIKASHRVAFNIIHNMECRRRATQTRPKTSQANKHRGTHRAHCGEIIIYKKQLCLIQCMWYSTFACGCSAGEAKKQIENYESRTTLLSFENCCLFSFIRNACPPVRTNTIVPIRNILLSLTFKEKQEERNDGFHKQFDRRRINECP